MKLVNTCYSSDLPNSLNVNAVMEKVPKNKYTKMKVWGKLQICC